MTRRRPSAQCARRSRKGGTLERWPSSSSRDWTLVALSSVGLALCAAQLWPGPAAPPRRSCKPSREARRRRNEGPAWYVGCFSSESWFGGRISQSGGAYFGPTVFQAAERGHRYVAVARRDFDGPSFHFDHLTTDVRAFPDGDLWGGGCDNACADDAARKCGCADIDCAKQQATLAHPRRWAVYEVNLSWVRSAPALDPLGIVHDDDDVGPTPEPDPPACDHVWDQRCEQHAEDLLYRTARSAYWDHLGF
ncbi:hypothetical protein CTAYLR_000468 [Chrysophaeum taylorii]|uniref:Uncharacterized protein n=1 Tax=Chrysophaeum taylorii TaxID=2483200 RepID=A0AAD7UHT6_9STRA|nr:hypothetical protein CTAYLR_000468 [Chrysophaeum taylorii]